MADQPPKPNDEQESRPAEAAFVVTPRIRIPWRELEFTHSRSSGPGGQNVNKVNSKVQLRWQVTQSLALPELVKSRFLAANANRLTTDGELYLASEQSRDQKKNQEFCLEKLAELIRQATITPRKRKATRPTRASKERRIAEKKHNQQRRNSRSIRDAE